jgi:hypothetical protein
MMIIRTMTIRTMKEVLASDVAWNRCVTMPDGEFLIILRNGLVRPSRVLQ